MSALQAAQERLEQLKVEAAGEVDVTRDDSLQVAEAGATWIQTLLDRHGLEVDDAMEVCQSLADGTVPNLAFMVAEKRIDPRASLVAAIGAGFFNGLGVGLELDEGRVTITLDRQTAEDALIGVLEQGELGGRRARAQRELLDAIRVELSARTPEIPMPDGHPAAEFQPPE